MGALNSYHMAITPKQSKGGLQSMDPVGSAGMRAHLRPGPMVEAWEIAFDRMTAAERNAIRDIFLAVGYSGSLLWTSPDDAGDKRYQFVGGSYKSKTMSAANFSISFTLRFAAGVPN
jgi:hypothetical protein